MYDTKSIDQFVEENKGLLLIENKRSETLEIHQSLDKKHISFNRRAVDNILKRKDAHNEPFLQIDFCSGKKILLTKSLIGFAPAACAGLDPCKLPKVVTTSDLLSVIEAIESSIQGQENYEEKLEDVQLFFESIAGGAEAVGFHMAGERLWVEKLLSRPLDRFEKTFF